MAPLDQVDHFINTVYTDPRFRPPRPRRRCERTKMSAARPPGSVRPRSRRLFIQTDYTSTSFLEVPQREFLDGALWRTARSVSSRILERRSFCTRILSSLLRWEIWKICDCGQIPGNRHLPRDNDGVELAGRDGGRGLGELLPVLPLPRGGHHPHLSDRPRGPVQQSRSSKAEGC